MKLDVKKLSVPTKEVKIDSFEDTITIYPIGGFGLLKLKELSEKLSKEKENSDLQEECVRFALKWGCKCSDEDIDYLVENDLVACIQLTEKVIEFSSEYNQKKIDLSTLAKKNSKK